MTFPRPPGSPVDGIDRAVRQTLAARDKASSVAAYRALLGAVGNDHAGTYWPVVLALVSALEEPLRDGGEWARHAALEALVDLCGSFEPEPGHETWGGVSLASRLRIRAETLLPSIEPIAAGDGIAAPGAANLLELLREPPA